MAFPMSSPSHSSHIPCSLISSPGESHVHLSGLSEKAAVKLCWDVRGVDVQKSIPGFGILIVFPVSMEKMSQQGLTCTWHLLDCVSSCGVSA